MRYFYFIKTRITEDGFYNINSNFIYGVDVDIFLNALMDEVVNAIYKTSGDYNVYFINKKGFKEPMTSLAEIRENIRKCLEVIDLNFRINIIDEEGTDMMVWIEPKEYKVSSSGTVPIKVIDVDDPDNILFYNEYTAEDFTRNIDFFTDLVNDFLDNGFNVILNDIRLNDIGYFQEIKFQQDEKERLYIEMNYENEDGVDEIALLYHEEFLHFDLVRLNYIRQLKGLSIVK